MPAAPPEPEPQHYPQLVAHVDGGARGNPGPAGYGAVLRTPDGAVRAELCGFLGVTTNNVAEYQGLLAALRWAREVGARELLVHADSELLVHQMNGRYKVRAPHLQPLHGEARRLAAGLARFRIEHVPRAENKDADRLANKAMDEGTSGK